MIKPILLANVENFSIENVHIVCSHGWGISLEACAYGNVDKIDFDSCMSKTIKKQADHCPLVFIVILL